MTGKTVKQMLINLYTEEREQERCQIVHVLKSKAAEIVISYKTDVAKLQTELTNLNDREKEIRVKMQAQNAVIDRELKNAKLFTFTPKACGDALHNSLMQFDKDTTKHIKEILED